MLTFSLLHSKLPRLAKPAQAYFEDVSKIGVEGQLQMHYFGLCSVVDQVYVFM